MKLKGRSEWSSLKHERRVKDLLRAAGGKKMEVPYRDQGLSRLSVIFLPKELPRGRK